MNDKPQLKQDSQYALSVERGEGVHPKDFDWLAKNVPCRTACPAQTNIPGYLDEIRQGNYDAAYRINLEDNVFPAVLGRACTRPCEPACRHGWDGLGESVRICFAKRSAETFMQQQDPVVLAPVFPDSGKRVTIIGAGPAGLTVARELRRWGHAVTVLEQNEEPGGLMVQGIPAFRLPRDLVRKEIAQIVALGVEIRCGESVTSVENLRELSAHCDALVIAAGTHEPTMPVLPGAELQGVQHGLEFLKEVNAGARPDLGTNVVVIGGGFTAVDCVRMARRLGSEKVGMYYRRSASEMYVGEHELTHFQQEQIDYEFQVSPVEILGENGKVRAIRFVRTQLVEQDGEDRAFPQPIEGSEFELPADTVLFGTGQKANAGLWSQLQEENDSLFLAGDASTGASNLIESIGNGKQVAREIDRSLMGKNRFRETVQVEDIVQTGRTREMDAIPPQRMPEIDGNARGLIDEVETGFEQDAAQTEASRCYLCHYKFEIDNELCIYCDRCLKVKPVEGCIVKVSSLIYDDAERISGYLPSTRTSNYNMLYLDQDQCIRCNACVEVCPVECITLQKVTPVTKPVA